MMSCMDGMSGMGWMMLPMVVIFFLAMVGLLLGTTALIKYLRKD
jgi:hypothetical protein